jgi:hypothetical protein
MFSDLVGYSSRELENRFVSPRSRWRTGSQREITWLFPLLMCWERVSLSRVRTFQDMATIWISVTFVVMEFQGFTAKLSKNWDAVLKKSWPYDPYRSEEIISTDDKTRNLRFIHEISQKFNHCGAIQALTDWSWAWEQIPSVLEFLLANEIHVETGLHGLCELVGRFQPRERDWKACSNLCSCD